jgi:hypothetical protein
MSPRDFTRRCGKHYGTSLTGRRLICRRPAGHGGAHAIQYKVGDLLGEQQRKAA